MRWWLWRQEIYVVVTQHSPLSPSGGCIRRFTSNKRTMLILGFLTAIVSFGADPRVMVSTGYAVWPTPFNPPYILNGTNKLISKCKGVMIHCSEFILR
ncbi:hypothetical protein QL285_038239 [Trifolium repens]|nr:hypothetical protein QL285_038239 [Trifolium repens]